MIDVCGSDPNNKQVNFDLMINKQFFTLLIKKLSKLYFKSFFFIIFLHIIMYMIKIICFIKPNKTRMNYLFLDFYYYYYYYYRYKLFLRSSFNSQFGRVSFIK